MKKLLIYLKNYKKESVLGPLFKLLEATLELLVPLVMAAIIDVGIVQEDKGYILKMCGVLVLLGAIGLIFSITAQYFAAKAAVGFATEIRHSLFAHIETFSYSELDTIGTSTLITRMTSDMNQVQQGMNLTLRLLLRSPFVVFGAMVMAFTIDVRGALVFVAAIPLLSLVVFGIMLVSIPMYKKVQEALDKVLGITRENLTGVRVIRAFGKEKEEMVEFKEKNEFLTQMQKNVGRISGLMNPLTYVMINLAIVVLIYTGAIRVERGLLTQGAVVALYNYMSQILEELIKLANLIINITKAVACGNRIQSVFEQTTTQIDGERKDLGEGPVAISFSQVSLTYPLAKEPSLEDITFQANKGEMIGVIGGTGSGKTSLVNLVARFYDATEGKIQFYGEDITSYKESALHRFVSVVPQKAALFKGTIRENLKWGNPQATEEELQQALSIAQALEVVEKKKEGLDTRVEQGGKNFSGGQKQRLTIARALAGQPKILILDDSSSALDYATDARLREAIRTQLTEMTVFVVSQRASSVLHADKILVLEDGKIAGAGTHEELLASCKVYQEIYESQFKKEEA